MSRRRRGFEIPPWMLLTGFLGAFLLGIVVEEVREGPAARLELVERICALECARRCPEPDF